MATPAGSESKGGQARRERLLRDLPGALEREEKRVFAAAKRIEATGDKARAALLFDASRKAYQALEDVRRAQSGGSGLDEALERANQMLTRIAHTT